MAFTITHSVVSGAAANPDVDVDGVAWDANHTITGSVAASEVTSPAALTKTDDTNVTLTLGGAPTTALLSATSITVGWTGTLAAGRGGFGADVSASSGVPLFATGTATFTSTTGTGNFVRASSPTLVTPALGTPSAAVLTNATGLPISTGVAGLGTGIATFLATPSSANLRAALTDETGTGVAYFVGGALGTPSSGVATNLTGTASGLTAGNVTTNANLTGDVTSVGNATTIANNAVTNAKMATMAAYTLKGNATGSSAVPTDIDVTALTAKASPASADIVLIQDSAASNAFKKTTVGALSTAGSVGSLNGKTGTLTWSVVVQKFTSSGTYTPTTGMVYCVIECVGGGGGGGGVAGTAGDIFIAGGGGSGSYSRLVASAATIGASKTVTIGAAGAGGAAGANNGSAGGDTSVGTLCIGKGGGAGTAASIGISNILGGVGGVAGTGDLTPAGNPGESGFYAIGTSILVGSGKGGSSFFGGGAVCAAIVAAVATAGVAAGAHGSGGSGANAVNTASTAAGGNGSAGVVIVTEYVIA